MKIITNKKWKEIKKCMVSLEDDLQEQRNITQRYLDQREKLSISNLQLLAQNENLGCEIDDLKKELKRLKTLCTKNKINYKKEEKKSNE